MGLASCYNFDRKMDRRPPRLVRLIRNTIASPGSWDGPSQTTGIGPYVSPDAIDTDPAAPAFETVIVAATAVAIGGGITANVVTHQRFLEEALRVF